MKLSCHNCLASDLIFLQIVDTQKDPHEPGYFGLQISFNTVAVIVETEVFRSARASCTTSGGPVRAKNLDTYIQAYMPHESSGDSSNQPIGHTKEISWPHLTLKITSTALLIIGGPIKFPC